MNEQYGQLIEPAPVKFSFDAPGWYVLGALLLIVLLFAIWLIYKYYQRNRYRSVAIKQLQLMQQAFSTERQYGVLVYEANMLLKRITMARYDRSAVAGIRGSEWIAYLNKTTKRALFDNADGLLLNDTIYETNNTITADTADGFVEKSKEWIKRHKRKLKNESKQ